mgnify:CR=1 FL=1
MSLNLAKKDIFTFIFYVFLGVSVGYGLKSVVAWYNTPPEFINVDTSQHFKETNHQIVLYSTSWCPACKMTREFLEKNSIDYLERDIESGDKKINFLFKSIGEPGVPKIVTQSGIVNGYIPDLILRNSK